MLPPANDCSARAACNVHAHMFSVARFWTLHQHVAFGGRRLFIAAVSPFPPSLRWQQHVESDLNVGPRISRLLQRERASEQEEDVFI